MTDVGVRNKVELDKAQLSEDDQQIVLAWEQLFASAGWKLLVQRFGPRYKGTVSALESATSQRALGMAQANRALLREIIRLPEVLETEYNNAIGEAAADAEEDLESRGAMA